VTELAWRHSEVFHHDDAPTATIAIPVGKIAVRHRRVQTLAHEVVEARLQLADLAAFEPFRPVGLEANVARNASRLANLIEVQREP